VFFLAILYWLNCPSGHGRFILASPDLADLSCTVIQFRNIYSQNALAPASLPNLKYKFPKQKYKNLKK
jgi:hypothetical protein